MTTCLQGVTALPACHLRVSEQLPWSQTCQGLEGGRR